MGTSSAIDSATPVCGARRHAINSQDSLGHVLLVEDDHMLRMVSAETLADLGFHAIEAGNATEALDLFAAHPEIDVVMTDVRLPGMDGRQLAVEVCKRRPGARILFVTGYGVRAVAGVAVPNGTADYLAKPYEPAQLDAALRRLLDR